MALPQTYLWARWDFIKGLQRRTVLINYLRERWSVYSFVYCVYSCCITNKMSLLMTSVLVDSSMWPYMFNSCTAATNSLFVQEVFPMEHHPAFRPFSLHKLWKDWKSFIHRIMPVTGDAGEGEAGLGFGRPSHSLYDKNKVRRASNNLEVELSCKLHKP